MATNMMRAVQVSKFGGPEQMKVVSVAMPKPGENQVGNMVLY